mmetsp:Transcript_28241/g.45476  ORF Transcript_28241/g.45476 Transcript_28241/m.45476 type:complete len:84 (+) Transcript_28241:3638-3889(+)
MMESGNEDMGADDEVEYIKNILRNAGNELPFIKLESIKPGRLGLVMLMLITAFCYAIIGIAVSVTAFTGTSICQESKQKATVS